MARIRFQKRSALSSRRRLCSITFQFRILFELTKQCKSTLSDFPHCELQPASGCFAAVVNFWSGAAAVSIRSRSDVTCLRTHLDDNHHNHFFSLWNPRVADCKVMDKFVEQLNAALDKGDVVSEDAAPSEVHRVSQA